MTGDQIRDTFLRFFEGKGHRVFPSSPLIPSEDPTLLLTNAGMVQFKAYFMGELSPPSPRPASCQKCFRTTDIELVGNIKHLTFFEMLGNFSIGDYFKKEAIEYAWEFVTEHLRLPKERLWITIFLDDDESFGYWRELGVPEERIVRHGEDNNFWGPAGESGPCGPCTEIHYDFGEGFGCGQPTCVPGCDCDRFLEIWNLVFTQYYQDKNGNRSPLPKNNVDTGMGLERTATVVQGKRSFYETDLFAPIVNKVAELAGARYGEDEKTDRALRIITEHGRAVAFLIADGILPANEGRGYVLRRVLRRAVRFGRILGLDKPFLADVAKVVIDHMGHIYPELVQNENLILRIIEQEEERFGQTLNTGLVLLTEIMEQAREGIIPGEQIFRLYDTYGFPKELSAEIAAENGLSVDLDGFEREMERQRERARAAHKFGLGEKRIAEVYQLLSGLKTEFCGYDRFKDTSIVTGLIADGQQANVASEGQEVEVITESTPFYAEMGGQVGDSGEIGNVEQKGKVIVIETVRPLAEHPDFIVHRGRVVEGQMLLEDWVSLEVDAERRLNIARNHTATHLLHSALRQVLGSHVRQMGSLVGPDRLRFDFSHHASVTEEELEKIQRLVNEKIRSNLAVESKMMPYDQAIAEGAIALFGEKYGDMARIVKIKAPDEAEVFSAELCGGTHVSRTGEIGLFQIISEGSIGAGLRRIEAMTGGRAERLVAERFSILEAIARQLQTPPAEVQSKIASIIAELESERKRAAALERQLLKEATESLLSQVELIGDVTVLAAQVPASSMEKMREMGGRLKQRIGSGVIILGAVQDNKPSFVAMATADLVARGFHAGQLIKQVAAVTGGSGGGRAELGQAGGKNKDKLGQALAHGKELIKKWITQGFESQG